MFGLPKHLFRFCLILSLFLHLLILGGPGWRLGSLTKDRPQLLESHLLIPPPATLTQSAPQIEPGVPPLPAERHPKISQPPAEPSPQITRPQNSQPEQSQLENKPAPAIGPASPQSEIAPPPPDTAPPLPRAGRIVFVRHQGIDGPAVGRLTHEWQHDDTTYTLRSISESTGLVRWFGAPSLAQTSEGDFCQGELKPTRFTEEQDGATRTAQFDWPRKKITQDRSSANLPDAAQDALTVLYQLMRILQRGGGSLAIADGKGLRYYGLVLLSEDTLQFGPRLLHTWHLRLGTGGPDTTEVWLAQEEGGLPVRIRQTDADGNLSDWSVDELYVDGRPSPGGG